MGMDNHRLLCKILSVARGEERCWGDERATWRRGFTGQKGGCLRWKQIGSILAHSYPRTHTDMLTSTHYAHTHTSVQTYHAHTYPLHTHTHTHLHKHVLTGIPYPYPHSTHIHTYYTGAHVHIYTFTSHTHTHVLILNTQHIACTHVYSYTHMQTCNLFSDSLKVSAHFFP